MSRHSITSSAGLRGLVAGVAAASLATCESPAAAGLERLQVTIDSPSEGATRYAASVDVTGTIAGAEAPAVTYSVAGKPYAAADVIDGTPLKFHISLDSLTAGPVALTVKVTDRGRAAMATRGFTYERVTLTLQAPFAADTLHGRVIGFSGLVSLSSASVRWSLNGGAENVTQAYPPNPSTGQSKYESEAWPLPDGRSVITVRAYIDSQVVAADSFAVQVDVPVAHYTATAVTGPGSIEVTGSFLSNDGRIAGSWRTAADATARPFTWRAGTFVTLDSMRQVKGLNNVGQVLGDRVVSVVSGLARTVLWQGGVYTMIDTLEAAAAINDQGDLVRSLTAGYWRNGQLVSYTTPPTTGPLSVASINNSGQIAGGRINFTNRPTPVVWTSPTTWSVPPLPLYDWLPPYRTTGVSRISDGGHMLLSTTFFPVFSQISDFFLPRSLFLYQGQATDLNTVVGHGTIAAGVNASGAVAGSYIPSAGVIRAFTWKNGRTTDVVIDEAGWTLESVLAINDLGQLSVKARSAATGNSATLILTPR